MEMFDVTMLQYRWVAIPRSHGLLVDFVYATPGALADYQWVAAAPTEPCEWQRYLSVKFAEALKDVSESSASKCRLAKVLHQSAVCLNTRLFARPDHDPKTLGAVQFRNLGGPQVGLPQAGIHSMTLVLWFEYFSRTDRYCAELLDRCDADIVGTLKCLRIVLSRDVGYDITHIRSKIH